MQMRLGDVAPAAADGQLVAVVERVVQNEMQQATIRSMLRRRDGSDFPVVASLCRVDSEGDTYLVLVASEVGAQSRAAAAESQPLAGRLSCRPVSGSPWQPTAKAKPGNLSMQPIRPCTGPRPAAGRASSKSTAAAKTAATCRRCQTKTQRRSTSYRSASRRRR